MCRRCIHKQTPTNPNPMKILKEILKVIGVWLVLMIIFWIFAMISRECDNKKEREIRKSIVITMQFRSHREEARIYDFWFKNEKGIDFHDVHGFLYLTGSKDDHEKIPFYRNRWSIGDEIHIPADGKTVYKTQKVEMEMKTREGSYYWSWECD